MKKKEILHLLKAFSDDREIFAYINKDKHVVSCDDWEFLRLVREDVHQQDASLRSRR